MACNADIPKTTRFYLGDIDAAADSLRDMGYFTQNERDFIAKFVYRYPEAINAVSSVLWSQPKVEGLHVSSGAISQQTDLPSGEYSSTAVKTESTYSPPQTKKVMSEGAEKSPTTNERTEAKKLELFVQLCHQRKFSVKSSTQTKIPSPLSKFSSHPAIPEVTIVPPTPRVESFDPDSSCRDDVMEGIQRLSDSHANEPSVQKVSMKGHGVIDRVPEADKPEIQKGKAVDTAGRLAMKTELPYVGLADMRDNQLVNCGSNHSTPGDEMIHRYDNTGDREDSIGSLAASAARTTKWGKPVDDKTANYDGDIVGGSNSADLSRGRAMLEKMGWEDGQGLGRDSCGTLEPLIQVIKVSKGGLGSGRNVTSFDPTWPSSENTPPTDLGTKPAWDKSSTCDEKTLQIFSKIPAPPALSTTSKNYGSSKYPKSGIIASFIKEGLGSGPRDLKLLAHLQGTNEYKNTRHHLGLEVEALSTQQGANSRYPVMKMLQVNIGDRLELLNMSGHNKFAAKIVGTQVKGMVVIEHVRMEKEPNYSDEKEEIFGVWTGSSTTFDAYSFPIDAQRQIG